MIKKISALLLALTLSLSVLAGCGNKNNEDSSTADASQAEAATTDGEDTTTTEEETAEPTVTIPDPSLTVDGQSVDISNLVMCTIDGYEVSFEEFRFYYYYTLDTYTTSWGITADKLAEDPDRFAQFLDDVVLCIKQELVTQTLAAENGLELDEDDLAAVESQYQTAKGNYDSEEAYLNDLKSAYLTDELYHTMLTRAQLYTKVMNTLFSNDGVYATSKETFRELMQDENEYAHEYHVMIPFYSQAELTDESAAADYDSYTLYQKISAKSAAYAALDDDGKAAAKEQAKKVAEEVCKKAADGEDFEKLIEEYGWDLGLEDPSDGYYIQKDNVGGYPDELLAEAFALKVGETSKEPVENDTYGFFVVKRLEPDMDYVEENIVAMINTHDTPAIQDKFNEVIDSMKVTYFDSWDKLDATSIT